jgi:O-antigen/teichoic acid export membrane protein
LHKASSVVNANRPVLGPLVKTTTVLLIVGVPLFGVLFVFGEDIFQLILGDKWIHAGRYVEILSPWFLAALVVTPSSASFVVLGKQASLFRYQFVMSAGRLGVFLVAYLFVLTPEETLELFALVSMVGNLAILVKALCLTRTALTGKA